MRDFNAPLTAMDRSTRQKINKETQALNDALNQMDLIDIYRTFHPIATEYTFFSSAHRTFSKIVHILGYKSSLSNFKKMEILSSIFSNHNAIQLEINNKKKTAKNANTWRLNNMLLNNQWITEEIKEEIKKYLEANDNKDMTLQTYGMQQSHSERKVYSNTGLPQETRKSSNKQANFKSKAAREGRTDKT